MTRFIPQHDGSLLILTAPARLESRKIVFDKDETGSQPFFSWNRKKEEVELFNTPKAWTLENLSEFDIDQWVEAMKILAAHAKLLENEPSQFGLVLKSSPTPFYNQAGASYAHIALSAAPLWLASNKSQAWFAPEADPTEIGTLYLIPLVETYRTNNSRNYSIDYRVSWELRQVQIDDKGTHAESVPWNAQKDIKAFARMILKNEGEFVSISRSLEGSPAMLEYLSKRDFFNVYDKLWAESRPRTKRVNADKVAEAVGAAYWSLGLDERKLISSTGIDNKIFLGAVNRDGNGKLNKLARRNIGVRLILTRLGGYRTSNPQAAEDAHASLIRAVGKKLADDTGHSLIRVREIAETGFTEGVFYATPDASLFARSYPYRKVPSSFESFDKEPNNKVIETYKLDTQSWERA